jgi:prepilin-type N-terminal cleavage/methylation domain-containing protein
MKTRQHRRGFTAVELVVVVALIAFLFTMLVPILVRAREMAKRVYCLNNLHQTSKITSMYNLDYGQAPYSSTWLVDFSFLTKYIDGKYGIMECPATTDTVASAADLNGGTSYHYMGSRHDWEKNNLASGDGSEYGFDAYNPTIITMLSEREQKVLYDKSDRTHYGYFNAIFIESGHSASEPSSNSDNYWFLTATGTINFDDEDDSGGDSGGGGVENGGGGDSGDVGGGDDGGDDDDGDGDRKPWKARIIHYPPGNPGNQQEITVGWAAWPAHQAHGDILLEVLYKK